MVPLLLFAGGLALLVLGAHWLVRGAAGLASAVGISPLVVGLTVVAYGTSAPELLVSANAALTGRPDLALGNVVGSNICNVLLILGLSALITPLVVDQRLVRLEVPLLIGISFLVWILALDGHLSRVEGGLLVAGGIAYTIFVVRQSRRDGANVTAEYAAQQPPRSSGRGARFLDPGRAVLGLALLALGAQWLLRSAVFIAQALGVSELLIGLTVVALGTSLPELATSVVAALRGARDIAVGNVIGSNLFNLLGVLGFASLVSPSGVAVSPTALRLDLPIMLAVAAACLPIFFSGHRISRAEGFLLLAFFVAYVAWLVLEATGHAGRRLYAVAMLGFVLPLTAIGLLASFVQSLRAQRRDSAGPAAPE